jgi:hypothetical protein
MPHQTNPEEMPTTGSVKPVEARDADQLRAAFWDTHAARLHGFALLITIGDRQRAASAAATAMAAGAERAAELRHPERAAGWLRHQVIRELRRTRRTPNLAAKERHAALRGLGATKAVISSLEGLTVERRAALVAGTLEGLGLPDVATILDTDLIRASRAVEGARREYLAAAAREATPAKSAGPGPLAQRIGMISARALGSAPVEEPR